MLDNEAYTGAVVSGISAKDGQPPVRVKKLLGARAPKQANSRRASSPYLLSGWSLAPSAVNN